MDRGAVVLLVLALILGGTLFFIYEKYQVPMNKDFSNISISAEYDGKKIITGFKAGDIEGNTTDSYELIKMQSGKQITIENINLENQSFYKVVKELNVTKENQRIDMILEKPIEPKIEITNSSPIAIQIETSSFKDMKVCLVWSLNYVFVRAENLTSITKLKGYESWDRCYETDFNSGMTKIYISYQELNPVTENDYIKISLITPEFLGTQDEVIKIR